jgi:hypothetical protein
MSTGLRIDACFVTPLNGLFLTCRGEKKYGVIQYYTMYSINMWFFRCKIPYLSWWLSEQGMRTSLHYGPMLRISP